MTHGSESEEFRASVSRLPVGLSTPVAGVCREFVDLSVRDAVFEIVRPEPGVELTFSDAVSGLCGAVDALERISTGPADQNAKMIAELELKRIRGERGGGDA